MTANESRPKKENEQPLNHPPQTITRPELLRDGSDAKFRDLVHGLIALGARHQQIRAGHARMIDMPPPRYTVLVAAAHLIGRDDRIGIQEIAKHLQVSPAHVSLETNALAKAGFMSKERSEEDSRVTTLAITEKGWSVLAKLAPVQARVNDIQFAQLTSEEFEEFLRLTQLLIKNSDKALEYQRYIASFQNRVIEAEDTFI